MEGIANRDEAEKCRDLAKAFMTKGQYEKAVKFFDKSWRLYQLPGVDALKSKAEGLLRAQSQGGARSSSSSSSSPKPSTPSSASSSSGGDTGRPYTSEQESGAKKILALAKKGHYETLGLSKSSTENEIKKAYRKLALKFHPDKNSAPSAEGAFKAISSAFDCLSDPKKKEMYDMYGSEEPGAGGMGGGGGMRGGQNFNMNGHDVSPEELFEMFFNGGMRRRGGGFGGQTFHFGGGMPRRQQRAHPEQHEREEQRGGGGGGFMSMLQLLPLLLLFLMSFGGFGSGPTGSADMYGAGRGNLPYALHRTGRFQVERETSLLGKDIHIPFYVADTFAMRQARTLTELRKVEKQVYLEFKEVLSSKCHSEKDYKRKRIDNLKRQRRNKAVTEELEKATSMATPSCEKYEAIYKSSSSRSAPRWS